MAWTYTDPTASEKDEVRFLVGDTDTTDQLVQDEEITYFLALYPKPSGKPAYLAAAAVCDAIAAKMARNAQRSLGDLSIAAQQQYEHYVAEAARLRHAYATNGKGDSGGWKGLPVLGGGGRTYLGRTSG